MQLTDDIASADWVIALMGSRLNLRRLRGHVDLYPRVRGWNLQTIAPSSYIGPISLASSIVQSIKTMDVTLMLHPSIAAAIKKQEEQQGRSSAFLSDAATSDDVFDSGTAFTLRRSQVTAVKWLEVEEDRGVGKLLAFDTGTGKTAISFSELCRMHRLGQEAIPLFITTAGLARNAKREYKKLTGKDAYILEGRIPSGPQLGTILRKIAPAYILNYEVLGTSAESEEGEDVTYLWAEAINLAFHHGAITHVIFDEMHRLRNPKAKSTRAVLAIDPTIVRRGLTATPVVNELENLALMFKLLNPKDDQFQSIASFAARWGPYFNTESRRETFYRAMSRYMLRRRTSDMVDLPPVTRSFLSFDPSPQQIDRYVSALKRLTFIDNRGSSFDITKPIALLTRLRQITDDASVDFTISWVEEYLEENPDNKVIIFAQFKEAAHKLAMRLGSKMSIDEDVPFKVRETLQDDFQNNPNTRVLVGTLGTMKEGFNLTAASTIVFNTYAYTPMEHKQGEGRAFHRLGDPRTGNCVYATAEWDAVGRILGDTKFLNITRFMRDLLEGKQSLIDNAVELSAEWSKNAEGLLEQASKYFPGK